MKSRRQQIAALVSEADASTDISPKDFRKILPIKKRILQNGKENKEGLSPRKSLGLNAPNVEDVRKTLKESDVKIDEEKSHSDKKSKHQNINDITHKLDARKQLFCGDAKDPAEDERTLGFKTKIKDRWSSLPRKCQTPSEETPKKAIKLDNRRSTRASTNSPITPRRSKSPTPKKSSRKRSLEIEDEVPEKKRKGADSEEKAKEKSEISVVDSPKARIVKTFGKRAHSEESDKSDNLEYTTPLKKRKSLAVRAVKQCTPESKIIRKCETPRTPLEEARISLHVSAVPQSLPCREREFDNIYNFVENKLIDGIGGCMYISGVPGTGKTATVTSVVKKLQAAAKAGQVPQFNYIELNGMRLSDPRQAYIHLWQGIAKKKERISADQAQKRLDVCFNKTDCKKVTTVVLVDELDLMCTRKQDVVYNLLDWPSRPSSRLVVLTIANTMDMPERKLKGRVNSRLGLTRLTFLPYTYQQLEAIVLARLSGSDAFVPDAVRLVTRKVAAVSGDARRALDICRRATELPAPDEAVKMSHIEQAIKEMTNSNTVRLIRSCCEIEKLFLKSVADTCLRTGLEEVELLKVIEHLLSLCGLEGLSRPPVTAVLGVCYRLKCFRLLFSNDHRAGVLQRITLNISQDDLYYALKVES